jgi:hypothetical protein
MPVSGTISRFDMTIVVKIVRMSMRALSVMFSIVRMTNCGSRLLELNQMNMRTMISMMLVEKGSRAFSRCSRVEEK